MHYHKIFLDYFTRDTNAKYANRESYYQAQRLCCHNKQHAPPLASESAENAFSNFKSDLKTAFISKHSNQLNATNLAQE